MFVIKFLPRYCCCCCCCWRWRWRWA